MAVSFDVITPLPSPQELKQRERRVAERQQRQLRVADERRAQLLDVAWQLWQEGGEAGFNMRQLAQRAGYTAGALYAYFPGRGAILSAMQDRLLSELSEMVADVRASAKADRGARMRRDALVHSARTLFMERSLVWWGWLARDRSRLQLMLMAADPESSGDGGEPSSLLLRLSESLRPCLDALEGTGLPQEVVLQLHEEVLALGCGLLVLMGRAPAGADLASTENRLAQTLGRWLDWSLVHAGDSDAAASDQGDLFS